jgi:hypothetical protein
MDKNRMIIWSSLYDEDDYEEDFKQWCEDFDLDEDEQDIYDYINDNIENWYYDEKSMLKGVKCGNILCIADLGLWDGRRSGYKIIHTNNLSSILSSSCDDNEFYCDRYNVKADMYHHDGINYVTYREIKDGMEDKRGFKKMLELIYNQQEVPSWMVTKYTKSLRPKVSALYGWRK